MSVSRTPALNALARELLTLLDEHQQLVAHLVAAWPDPRAYDAVAAQLDRMRGLSTGLFGASVAWADLLIAHAELVQSLWALSAGGPQAIEALGRASERHANAVFALRARVLWWLPGPTPA